MELDSLNDPKKQQYFDWMMTEQRPDVVILNETKLTSLHFLGRYYSQLTLLKRSGSCITLRSLKSHRKVNPSVSYLNSTKIPSGDYEVFILYVYLEPGLEIFVSKKAKTNNYLTKDILKKDPGAKIIINEHLNGKLNKMLTSLVMARFTSAKKKRTKIRPYG